MKKVCLVILPALLCWTASVCPGRAEPVTIEPYYTFQVMILSLESNVRQALTELREKGFPAYVVVRKNRSGQVLYKIRIGKYATRSEAREAALDFKERRQQSYVLLKSRIDISPDEIAAAEAAARAHAHPAGQGKYFGSAADNQTKAGAAGESPDQGAAAGAQIAQRQSPPPGGALPVESEDYYTVQFGSLRSGKLAAEQVEQMRLKGYPAYVVTRQSEKGALLYKMRIGKYPSQGAADKAAMDFSAGEGLDAFVLKSQIALQEVLPAPERKEPIPVETDKQSGEDGGRQGTQPQRSARPSEPGKAGRTGSSEKKQVQNEDENKAEPDSVTKIYSYRSPSGALNLTNQYASIPQESHKDIDHISVFPVRYRRPDKSGPALIFDVDGEEKRVRLSGVRLPLSLQSDYVRGYFALNFENVALRLKYSPWETDADGALLGRLYLKEGTCINTDMLRHGVGACDSDTAPAGMRRECKEAEALARENRLGMWHLR